jgi:glyoxylase-like metal-dependent hydrolase (beta-lactamase superfamily II)
VTYSVRMVKVGEFPSLPGPELYWMRAWDEREPLFVYMAVIQGEKTVVVNTGAPIDLLAELNEHWRQFAGEGAMLRVREEEHPSRALRAIGVAPEDVHFVVLTPLQAYSVGNVDLFPNAQICISRSGWIAFHAPTYRDHPHDIRHMVIPQRVLLHLVTDAWPRVQLIEKEEEITPGVRVFWVGVHHRASMAVAVETAKGRVIISDCFFKYRNIEENIPLGINESLEECLAAYERIRREADIVVPLYDPEVLERHPGGIIA